MKQSVNIIISCIITITLFIGCLTALCNLVERKDSRNKYHDFFKQEEDFDVLFLGNSHTINAIYPMELWDDYGIISYNLAGHGNRIPTTYMVLKQALEYTTPKLVVLDCFHAKSPRMYSDSIEQAHLSMDVFPLTFQKLKNIHELINDPKLEAEFIWPFVTYHNRWDSLTKSDFKPIPSVEKGAEAKVGIAIPNDIPYVSPDSKLTEETNGTKYLRKIIELCQEKNIDILLTFYPYPSTAEEQMDANRVGDIANEYGVNYINFLTMDHIVDYNTDCLDPNNHLNASGGKKVSAYMGEYIMANYAIDDHRLDPEYAFWNDDFISYLQFKVNLLKTRDSLANYMMLLQDKDFTYDVTTENETQITSVYYNNELVDEAVFTDGLRVNK